jgi:Flp pilus assembly secretin CpaC
VQTLLQIVYWWHPLLWFANARIRRVREEAVDDAVMLALRDEAETYAPTLLEVAKLAFHRPLASLGLVGILESRSALRQRIERLVNFCAPRKAGLTIVSLFGIAAFTALAVPMGAAPPHTTNTSDAAGSPTAAGNTPSALPAMTNSETAGPATMIFKIDRSPDADSFKKLLLDTGVKIPPTAYFYTDNGLLLVRGDQEQLTLVKLAVLKLNGYLPKEIPPETNVSAGFRERLNAIIERSHQNTPEGFGKTETVPVASGNAPPPVFIEITNKTTSSTNASTILETRTFKVDANVFLASLQKQAGQQANASAVMRQLLSKVGVDLSPPKSIFFNERLGVLFVRATSQDLDTVEKATQVLNYTPAPQIHIKARFIEAPPEIVKSLSGIFIPTSATNVTGVLTSPELGSVLHAMQQSKGTETLAEPEATTLSGRQVQMRATQFITVITNFAFKETSTNSAVTPQTTQVECGPVLDTVASILPDGYTIDLRAIPSLVEFLGYDKPTNTIPTVTSTGAIVDVPRILPSFLVRQADAHLKLWDGQTVVLGGLISTQIQTIKDTEPVSGGKSAETLRFRTQTTRTVKKQELLVLITVTLVDPAGNRIHGDDEMLFARKSIPPQDAR